MNEKKIMVDWVKNISNPAIPENLSEEKQVYLLYLCSKLSNFKNQLIKDINEDYKGCTCSNKCRKGQAHCDKEGEAEVLFG